MFVLTALRYNNYFHFCHSVVPLVHISVSEDTIVEGESTNVTVSYTGSLHSDITIEVNITTKPGSAQGWLSLRLLLSCVYTLMDFCFFIKAGDDYDIVGIPSSQSVYLTSSNSQSAFTVRATDDVIVEDYEESFTISISVYEANIPVEITTSEVDIIIRDNEGKFYVQSIIYGIQYSKM